MGFLFLGHYMREFGPTIPSPSVEGRGNLRLASDIGKSEIASGTKRNLAMVNGLFYSILDSQPEFITYFVTGLEWVKELRQMGMAV
jgi:hypothetical protein